MTIMSAAKRCWRALFHVDQNIHMRMSVARFCHDRIPVIGPTLERILDRTLLWNYGLDVYSHTIKVRALSMPHPTGILLGGNGVVSRGRVVIMAGVKFVGRSPNNAEYLARHRESRVFQLGDNVVIGANSVVLGPVDICDNVMIAAMSLVNRSIVEPGVYAGIPARKIRDGDAGEEWVQHMQVSAGVG